MHRCLIKNNNKYEKIKNMYQVLVCNNNKKKIMTYNENFFLTKTYLSFSNHISKHLNIYCLFY